MRSDKQVTGVRNKQYDLISVLYHMLQGAETYEMYIRDAEQAGDEELAQYFRQAQEEHRNLAERGEKLLAKRLSQQGNR